MGIVHVRHPVPVFYVPRRGRKERFAFVAHRTPVELREVSPSEMRHVLAYAGAGATIDLGLDLHAHGTSLWLKVVETTSPHAGRVIGRREFLATLCVDEHVDGYALHPYVARTPLCAVDPEGYNDRGAEPGTLPPRQEIGSWVEQAEADLRRFLDEEVRLVGDEVYMRLPGPLALPALGTAHYHKPGASEYFVEPFPRRAMADFHAGAFPCRIDRVSEHRAFRTGFEGPAGAGAPRELPPGFESLDPALFNDEDIRLVANAVPRLALAHARQALAGCEGVARQRDFVREAERAFRPWLVRGMMSAVPLEEAGDVFAASLRFMEEFGEMTGGWDPEHDELARLVEEMALPRLRDPGPASEEDLDAMAGVAPGGMR